MRPKIQWAHLSTPWERIASDRNSRRNDFPFFVWHVAFKGRLAHYQSDMVSKVDAIGIGEEPEAKKVGWFN